MGEETGRPRKLDRVMRRYEPVVAAIAVVVLVAVYGPGGGGGDGASVDASRSTTPTRPAAVTPFSPSPRGGGASTPAPSRVPAPSSSPTGAPLAGPPSAPAPAEPGEAAPPDGEPAATPPFADDGAVGDVIAFADLPAPGPTGGVAASDSGEVFVAVAGADDEPPQLLRYDPAGERPRAYPLAPVEGTIPAIALGADDNMLYLTATAPAGVVTLNLETGAVAEHATIPDVAPCVPVVAAGECDGALTDNPPHPTALAFDADGNLFVADAGQGAIWKIEAGGGNATQWLVNPSFATPDAPTGPRGLAFDGAGNAVVSVGATFSDGPGGVYLVERADDGSAGAPTQLYEAPAESLPGALGLGRSGQVYLTLEGAGALVILDPKGTEVATIPAEGKLGAGAPVGLAFRGSSLLVPTRGADLAAAHALVRLPVEEPSGTVHRG